MTLIADYIRYVSEVRRYSPRTASIYADTLERFREFVQADSDDVLLCSLTPQIIRSWEVHLLDARKESARTVTMRLSVLSGFCRYMMKAGRIDSNPVRLVGRPKQEKRLPDFVQADAMARYRSGTEFFASREVFEAADIAMYDQILDRLIVDLLYGTGMRRAELIGVNRSDYDASRGVMHVLGKGDKMREIPLVDTLCEELSLYLRLVDNVGIEVRDVPAPLLVTKAGGRLYPMLVQRAVKGGLGSVSGITGRKSPHVLRHTLATELLDAGTDLSSIKELLGHSSLAATQVYTHNSIEKLKKVYGSAHPRASKK